MVNFALSPVVGMKIAVRIALLQWQANPADPANLWRLIIALITPGMREPRASHVPSSTPKAAIGQRARKDVATIAPQVPSIERLMLALDKVAEEFSNIVGAIRSVKAANEYMRLPGFLEEPAMSFRPSDYRRFPHQVAAPPTQLREENRRVLRIRKPSVMPPGRI